MKVRIISNGSDHIVQRKVWYWPFWHNVDSEINPSIPVHEFGQQDLALKFIATKLLKPKPKKPRWVVTMNHEAVVKKIERCVHEGS